MKTIYSRIAIICNPNSTNNGQELAHALKKDLKAYYKDLKIEVLPTKHAGHARELAQRVAGRGGQPLIISASGDGGYNEAINGVMESTNTSAICAVLPAGNANDHSRTLQSKPLLELIKQEKITSIDLLKMTAGDTTRFAHSYIGLGITPLVASELNKHNLTFVKELRIVIQRLYRYRSFKIKRGKHVIKLKSLIFANINQMAKVLTLAKQSQTNDGKFEIILVRAKKKRQLLFSLFKAAATSLEPAKSVSSYGFTTLKKMLVQLDGEVEAIDSGTDVKIESVHKAVRTLI